MGAHARDASDVLGRIAGRIIGLQQKPELNGTEVEVLGLLENGRVCCRVVDARYSPTAQQYIQWLCKHGTTAGDSRSLNINLGNLLLNAGVWGDRHRPCRRARTQWVQGQDRRLR